MVCFIIYSGHQSGVGLLFASCFIHIQIAHPVARTTVATYYGALIHSPFVLPIPRYALFSPRSAHFCCDTYTLIKVIGKRCNLPYLSDQQAI